MSLLQTGRTYSPGELGGSVAPFFKIPFFHVILILKKPYDLAQSKSGFLFISYAFS